MSRSEAQCNHDGDSDAGDLEDLDCTGGAIAIYSLTCCAWFKNLFIMVIIAYFWVWTSGNRATAIGVLNQMCRHNELNITFHSDGFEIVNTWNSRQSLKEVEHN